jgi:hypothetical protein
MEGAFAQQCLGKSGPPVRRHGNEEADTDWSPDWQVPFQPVRQFPRGTYRSNRISRPAAIASRASIAPMSMKLR